MSDSLHAEYIAAGTRAAIRSIARGDREEFTRLARESVEFHRPWLFLPTTDDAFDGYIGQLEQPDREGFLVCDQETGAVTGFVNVNNIVRGRFQSGYLGYGAFVPSAGRGYMAEGLGLVLRHAFGPLGLHRLEANIQPDNAASTGLVKRHGFRLEGFSPEYLFIDGAWRDHQRWAITREMLDEPA
ncbi:GNAT family N-acetyltransferase [Streptomyces sp. LX-29]|uniref:GNAT family N-acetyltransferase n=1 Tax=Streptomyces sp. LX-29 TaxID=2900152 RepID=UPI00240D6D7E|nr:GNAT family N-acetyltransferase [Streptomyces sp. LX-29]WFB06776.1 GNAT family N-acetyltransferase [Streptomyces sp. LX-29]